ncbi:MAG: hypothetical protein RLZZ303_2517 [Candidatus Hydrogenedentota bacterium]
MGWVRCLRGTLAASLCVGMLTALSGCPTQDAGLALLVSPDQLDFGKSANVINLQVRTNFSTTKPEPLTIQSDAGWILVGECTDAAEGCLVGSITESIIVPIGVDRRKMQLGVNRGTLILDVPGASRVLLDVVAEDNIAADFSVTSRRVGVGQTVIFNNTSSISDDAGGLLGYEWDFGDGAKTTMDSPTHVYGAPGVYTVSLTVRTENGVETITRESYIIVGDPKPSPDFSATPREIFTGERVQFSDLSTSTAGPVVRRQWDFGDGGSSTAQNPSYQFTRSGLFNVSLLVETEFGSATETKQGYILVKRKIAPEAIIGVNTVNPAVGDIVQFSDGSIPGTAPIRQRVWRFGDGAISTAQNPTHTYTRPGSFTVELTVTSDHGTNTASTTLNLDFASPTADFEVLDTNPSTCSSPLCPEAVQFVDRSSPGSGSIRAWLWNFGDGQTSTEQNPLHGYQQVGTYSVSLTVTTTSPSNNTATVTKQNLIVAVNPPRPNFSIGNLSPFTNTPVQFTNRTVIGTETDVTYQWDFDGSNATVTDRSTLVSPIYQYPQAGTFNPTLTATTPTRSEVFSRPIVVDGVTTADFIASTRTPTTATVVQFTDRSTLGARGAGGTPVAESYRWDLGDGTIKTERNPTHTYSAPGTYPVTLTVTYTHSGSGAFFTATKAESSFMTVRLPDPPVADFNIINTDCIFVNDTLNVSAVTNSAIDRYEWDFGDPGSGSQNTASTPNASHLYNTPGLYTVRLTVTDDALLPPFNTATKEIDIVVAELTELDQYVREPDPAFRFQQAGQPFNLSLGLFNAGVAYNLYMVSGLWRTSADIDVSGFDGISWKHNVTIVNPTNRVHDTAVLLVSGGSRNDAPPDAASLFDVSAPELGLATGAPLVIVDDIPAQPIAFRNDSVAQRVEDALIAYSYDRFLDDFDAGRPLYPAAADPWPAVHPMARAAVRAMDASQNFMQSIGEPIDDFIVTGASKRGWTTWLTGITDCRVKAIAPIVFDVLNIDENMIAQQRSLATQTFGVTGGFSDAVLDYTAFNIFGRLANVSADDAALELLAQVDPYEYRERVIVPKLLLNATGDEFFLSDSAQYYIDDLSGETSLSYIPNVGHGLGANAFSIEDTNSALFVLTGWILGVLQDVERPAVNWAFPDDNTIVVDLDDPSGGTPEVRLWSINNPTHRDFRKPITDAIGRTWTSQVLSRQSNGTYIGTVATPANGWTAYYIQVRFESDAQPEFNIPGLPDSEFVFSTPIRVVPDVYPQP